MCGPQEKNDAQKIIEKVGKNNCESLDDKNIFEVNHQNCEMNKISLENRLSQKQSWVGSGEIKHNKILLDLKNSLSPSIFVGYEKFEASTVLLGILSNEKTLDKLNKDSSNFFLVFKSTPFYAESGGQVGDAGSIYDANDNFIAKVTNTTKIDGDILLHHVTKNFEQLNVGKKYLLRIILDSFFENIVSVKSEKKKLKIMEL